MAVAVAGTVVGGDVVAVAAGGAVAVFGCSASCPFPRRCPPSIGGARLKNDLSVVHVVHLFLHYLHCGGG